MELIVQSQNAVNVFNTKTFQTESTKINVMMGKIYVSYNADGSAGEIQIEAELQTESGTQIVRKILTKSATPFDLTNVSVSPHTWLRNQVYSAVISVNPFGIPDEEWIKQY